MAVESWHTVEEIWEAFAHTIGATWERGDFWQPDRVRAQIGSWIVTLDVHQVSTRAAHVACTRLRAPLLNAADTFTFSAARIDTFHDGNEEPSPGQKIFCTGNSLFDSVYRVTSNDTVRINALLADGILREALSAQRHLGLGLERDAKGGGERFLVCLVVEVVRDPDRLLALFDLMTETLLRLERPE